MKWHIQRRIPCLANIDVRIKQEVLNLSLNQGSLAFTKVDRIAQPLHSSGFQPTNKDSVIMVMSTLDAHTRLGQKKKDSCVQVSEVKKIRVGRSKNIFILDFVFSLQMYRGFKKTGFWRSASLIKVPTA